MINRRHLGLAALGLGLAPIAAKAAVGAPAPASAALTREQDRQAILGMAGDYKVRFDFRETVPFVADYTPIPAKVSGGHESVRVIENTPTRVSLQHMLVIEGDGETFVIKHWRQDWVFEPANVLAYAGQSRWVLTPVAAADRAGAWSQTVWQTDDSPRYGGVGRWAHDAGASRWMSAETLRPLARRDAVRHPPYDRYTCTNRHALTPAGWAHEQDNAKIGDRDGKATTFVHEVVLNTYTRFSDYEVKAADAYWTATAPYWAAVRSAWDDAIARGNGVHVVEEAENGSVTGPTLMGLADDILKGKTTVAKAIAEARSTISEETA